jgi:hypothetical protein
VNTIESYVSNIPGVQSVQVALDSKLATVHSNLSDATIMDAISDVGTFFAALLQFHALRAALLFRIHRHGSSLSKFGGPCTSVPKYE